MKKLVVRVCISEEEIWEVLKVKKNKTPGIDGLPYEVYLILLPMFVPPLLELLFNPLLEQMSIPQNFTRGVSS